MINIVTGPVDSGKTTALTQIHRALCKRPGSGRFDRFGRLGSCGCECGCGGWLTPSFAIGGVKYGQSVMCVSCGETRLLGMRAGPYDPDAARCAFVFNNDAFRFAESIARRASDTAPEKPGLLFADEIGPLEVGAGHGRPGGGFARALNMLLDAAAKNGTDLYMSVRDTCLDDVIGAFGISEQQYSVIRLR